MTENATIAQADRLRDMAHDIERAKEHPSAIVRAAYGNWTQAQCDQVARRLRSVAGLGSFDLAHELIGIWHKAGSTDELIKRVLNLND